MASFVSAGGVISWGGWTIIPRRITFTSASAEVVTIPWLFSNKNSPPVVVPTGDFQGGGISVEYLRQTGSGPFTGAVGLSAPFTYSDATGYSYSANNMLCVDNVENVATGDVVTGTLEFVLTTFVGNNWS